MDKELLKTTRQAVKSGDIDTFIDLVETHEGLLEEVTGFGSWLHVASDHGQIEIVKYLVNKGLDVNLIGSIGKNGPIGEAAFRGHFEIVKYLFENGALLDDSNARRNPLLSAIYNGHTDIAKFFIDHGIDITKGYPIGNNESVDSYQYARMYGKTEIAEYMKEILIKTDYFLSKRKKYNPLVNRY